MIHLINGEECKIQEWSGEFSILISSVCFCDNWHNIEHKNPLRTKPTTFMCEVDQLRSMDLQKFIKTLYP